MAAKAFQNLNCKSLDERGFSSIEAIVLMVCFTLMVGFTLGSFGIIHTGILQSIGSRNYAFETFRHRTNLTYLRDADPTGTIQPDTLDSYADVSSKNIKGQNYRLHFDVAENVQDGKMQPSERTITKGRILEAVNRNEDFHVQISNEANLAAGKRYNNQDGVNPVWIKVAYGICMNAACQ
jgi:hypothetical protein